MKKTKDVYLSIAFKLEMAGSPVAVQSDLVLKKLGSIKGIAVEL